jgi:hypothetical protein
MYAAEYAIRSFDLRPLILSPYSAAKNSNPTFSYRKVNANATMAVVSAEVGLSTIIWIGPVLE